MKNNNTQFIKNGAFIISIILLSSCGGGGGKKNSSVSTTPTSNIPDSAAADPIAPLVASLPQAEPAKATQAILRVVHRNTISGVLSPDGEYVDSDNSVVEKRGPLGFYVEVDRDANQRYLIDPEDNGLAYFKVTTTKPNGSVRVHNFYGVSTGYYMTFDTSEVEFQQPENPLAACRKVDMRFQSLPAINESSRILINGSLVSLSIIEGSKGYIRDIQICPIDFEYHYLAFIAIEDSDSQITYGFNYYSNLQDNDILEINIDRQPDLVPWTASQSLASEFEIYGIQNGWEKFVHLYTSRSGDPSTGNFPKFTDLALSSYRFTTDKMEQGNGLHMTSREFPQEINQNDFAINEIAITDLELSPLDLTWLNMSSEQPKVISGIIFNSSFTETYAFMTEDPTIIANQSFDFPIEDLPLVIDSTLFGLTASTGSEPEDSAHLSQAALYSGFLYWPNVQSRNPQNMDLLLTANGTELLQVILDNVISTENLPTN